MSELLPKSVEVHLPADLEAIIAAHEAPDEGSIWTTVIHGALWEMRARVMGPEAVRRELAEEIEEALESGEGEEATPEWWKQFHARYEEEGRRLREAREAVLLGNLLLPDKLHDFVTTEIATGRFASATAVVCEAVRTCSWDWRTPPQNEGSSEPAAKSARGRSVRRESEQARRVDEDVVPSVCGKTLRI